MTRPPKLLLAAALGCVLAAPALATGLTTNLQEDAPPPQEQPPTEVAPTYEQLLAEFEALEDELRAAAKAATSKDERNDLRAERKGLPELFWPRMQAAADAGEGHALLWMAQYAKKAGISKQELPQTKRALYERVLAEHLEAEWFEEALMRIAGDRRDLGTDVVIELLTQVHGSEAAASTRSEAAFLIAAAYSRDKAEEQAVAWYRRLAEEFPDTPRAQEAKALVFELENLQIGMVAPDIEGADLDGVDFKLSDYRGKVVVLDFWGDW